MKLLCSFLRNIGLISFGFLTLFLWFCQSKLKVDLLIHHAVIYTVDSAFSIQEAMVVKQGKIVELGPSNTLLKKYAATEIIDALGQAIYPGFIDAHCHFTGYATDMRKCDLTGTASFEAIVDTLKKYAKTSATHWIYGRGWDQNDWPDKHYPDKAMLDELFPDRPVFLKRIDGHAALVNSKALELAGISASTKINGGSIELMNKKKET
jgi:predicted amidohydrolase YtcJ